MEEKMLNGSYCRPGNKQFITCISTISKHCQQYQSVTHIHTQSRTNRLKRELHSPGTHHLDPVSMQSVPPPQWQGQHHTLPVVLCPIQTQNNVQFKVWRESLLQSLCYIPSQMSYADQWVWSGVGRTPSTSGCFRRSSRCTGILWDR